MTFNFKTVSLQGAQLTKNQKRHLEEQKRVKFLNSTLTSLVDDAFSNLEKHKEQGRPATKLWQLDIVKTGTPYLGDVFIH